MSNKVTILVIFMIILSTLLTSCSVIEGIFKAGFGIGILVSVALVGLIIYLITKFLKK